MSFHKNQKGFTFTEIIIALAIMVLGFMATAQMQVMSLRQNQLSEQGTIATNLIQLISDRDIAELKSQHLLNSRAYLDAQAGNIPDCYYCNPCGTPPCACNVSTCPINPIEEIVETTFPPTGEGAATVFCTAVNMDDVNYNIDFKGSDSETCLSDADAISAAQGNPIIMIKDFDFVTVAGSGTDPDIVNVTFTYAAKSSNQFRKTGMGSLIMKDTLALQNFGVTAHIDNNWSPFITGWSEVYVPHIP